MVTPPNQRVSFLRSLNVRSSASKQWPGKKLTGGGMSDFIPQAHTEKVYRQVADI